MTTTGPGDFPLIARFEKRFNLLQPSHRDGFFMDFVLNMVQTYSAARRVMDFGRGEGVGTDPELF